MSGWEQFDEAKSQKRSNRQLLSRLILVLFGLTTVGILIGVPLYMRSQPDEIDLTGLTADEPLADGPRTIAAADPIMESAALEPTSGAGGGVFTDSLAEPNAEGDQFSRLANNIASKAPAHFPETDYTANRHGPLQIEYTVSGSGEHHVLNVGQATYGRTQIVGAASEWLVRPWWKPGWLPTSSDCGEQGTAAIGGHVSWGDRPGPFHDLGGMAEGDTIRCLSSTGTWHTYSVTEVVKIGYNNTNYYWQTSDDSNGSELTLFSCTPEVDGIIVVRAELLDS